MFFLDSPDLFLPGTPGNLDVTDYDFSSAATPAVPLDVFVSPLRGHKVRVVDGAVSLEAG